MLVISRKKNESVVIGLESIPANCRDQVTVTIIEVRPDGLGGHKVRLGITAPRQASVHRQEVWEAIRAAQNGGQ